MDEILTLFGYLENINSKKTYIKRPPKEIRCWYPRSAMSKMIQKIKVIRKATHNALGKKKKKCQE